jgi:ATP-dependent 26S proteasome regulatory subunit
VPSAASRLPRANPLTHAVPAPTPPQIALFYAVRYVLSNLDPQKTDRRKASKKGQQVLSAAELGHVDLASLDLNEYEQMIAAEIIPPSSINTTFASIGGLDDIIASLRESVIYPLMYPELFRQSDLLGAPKGVLLYGHPGCGKTMLAKALAKESGATFINLPLSSL